MFKVDPKGNRHELLKSKQRRCKICHKIRRKSCSICDVGLCQQECFLIFHEDFTSYHIYVEKFKCFGKNHRARINNLPYNHKLLVQCGPSNTGFQLFDIEQSRADIRLSSSNLSGAMYNVPERDYGATTATESAAAERQTAGIEKGAAEPGTIVTGIEGPVTLESSNAESSERGLTNVDPDHIIKNERLETDALDANVNLDPSQTSVRGTNSCINKALQE